MLGGEREGRSPFIAGREGAGAEGDESEVLRVQPLVQSLSLYRPVEADSYILNRRTVIADHDNIFQNAARTFQSKGVSPCLTYKSLLFFIP